MMGCRGRLDAGVDGMQGQMGCRGRWDAGVDGCRGG